MAGERWDPDDGLVPESPQLRAVDPDLGGYESMEWQPSNLEDFGYHNTGLFLNMDPSLNINASYLESLFDAQDWDRTLRLRKARLGQRMVLPLIIRGKTIMSRPDSGSEDNILSLDLINAMSLDYDRSPEHHKEFRVANGKLVKALGRILLEVVFAKDQSLGSLCAFYVFRYLVSPMIMGMPFLDGTETFVKNKHCLELQTLSVPEPLQICSLSSPRCRLYCQVDSELCLANADTGSGVDLMSLAYVERRGIHMKSVDMTTSMVQFADGSFDILAGQVDIQIAIGKHGGPSLFMTFLVLEGLTCDILLGEDFLYESEAFETHSDAFADSDCDDCCNANTIVLLKVAGGILSRFLNARSKKKSRPAPTEESAEEWLKENLGTFIARQGQEKDHVSSHTGIERTSHNVKASLTSDITEEIPGGLVEYLMSQLRNEDAQELHRQKLANASLDSQGRSARERAIRVEKHKADSYEGLRTQKLRIVADLQSPNEDSDMQGDLVYNEPSEEAGAHRSTSSECSEVDSSQADQDGGLDELASIILPPLSNREPPGFANKSSTNGPFICDHPGCKAAAFSTQYLLNSHANVHSQKRPHYCPVEGCNRSQGGKGFRRKNEMIRHGLVHAHPGYICPFCPEREHKYPRPDNLQRHVRVHHADKDMNDPQLREVLNQRQDGGGRGRRRRAGD